VAYEFEAMMVEQVKDVFASPREEVVEAQHLVPFADQPLAQVRAEKARTARH
jgi:hypothetical protein